LPIRPDLSDHRRNPLSFSVAENIGLGLIAYVILRLTTGRGRETLPLTFILTIIFSLHLLRAMFARFFWSASNQQTGCDPSLNLAPFAPDLLVFTQRCESTPYSRLLASFATEFSQVP
jgi:hypothetical protein